MDIAKKKVPPQFFFACLPSDFCRDALFFLFWDFIFFLLISYFRVPLFLVLILIVFLSYFCFFLVLLFLSSLISNRSALVMIHTYLRVQAESWAGC